MPDAIDYERLNQGPELQPDPGSRNPIVWFFLGHVLTSALGSFLLLAYFPATPEMREAVPCMFMGVYATGSVLSTLVAWYLFSRRQSVLQGRLVVSPPWLSGLLGMACALGGLGTVYLREPYADVAGFVATFIAPGLAAVLLARRRVG